MRAYHERMRPQREAERNARFDARFTEADLNRDGKLGRVEVQEKMPRMADRFAWIDDNQRRLPDARGTRSGPQAPLMAFNAARA